MNAVSSQLPWSADERRHWLIFLAIAFVVLFAGYGLRDPWPADEPRFVLVAKQMVESGNWLFPQRGHELYPDKPPLYFWLLAGCYLLIGSWRWSFLLPSLLASLATLWLTFDIGRRLWNPRIGLWAAAAILITPAFVYQAKRAQIDPTLLFFTTLSIYGMLRHLLLGPHWRWFYLGCFAAGLGVISKGVGFLPLLMLIPFTLMRRWQWQGIASLEQGNAARWWLGIGCFFVAILLWLVPMVSFALFDGDPTHRAYLQNILFKQTAQRYVDPWHHYEPFWYFGQVIALFWAPFSLAFLWLWKPWRVAFSLREAKVWLPLSWALIVIVFFSSSAGKRDMYILPALPVFALAAAPFLAAISQRRGFRMILFVFTTLLSLILLAAGLIAIIEQPDFALKIQVERGIDPTQARWLWGMLAGVGAIGLIMNLLGRLQHVLASCAAFFIALWLGWGLVVHPLLDGENSAREVTAKARLIAGPQKTIGLVAWKEQILLQMPGPVEEFGFRQPWEVQFARGIAWLRADPAQRVLFLEDSAAPKCVPEAQRQTVSVSNRRQWILLDAAAVSACTDTQTSINR